MRAALLLAAFLGVSMQLPSKEVVNVGPAPVGPYSPAVKAGGFIYVSGTLAQDDTGALVGKGDAGRQTRQILERIATVLAAAGSSLDHAVSVTVYLKSQADFAVMNDAYRTFWTADPPARTTVVTDLVLPDALVEISMIAVPKGAERTVIHPRTWVRSPNPYSYAIRAGDTLFLAGLVSRERPRQHRRARRRRRADESGAGQRRRAAPGRGHDARERRQREGVPA